MPPPSQHSRINLVDLKSQIVKRIGQERAGNYFGFLNRYLSHKLSKAEFDKLCSITLGQDNIPLHNQLVRSILKNAHQSKVPPPLVHVKDGLKLVRAGGKKSPSPDDGIHLAPSTASILPVWSNGDMPLLSPRKGRSGVRDRRIKDRPNPLGPNGRIGIVANQYHALSDLAIVRENGSIASCDMRRPVQHHQEGAAELPMSRQWVEKPVQNSQVSVHSKHPSDATLVEDGDEWDWREFVKSWRAGVPTPLGIPYCPASVGGPSTSQPFVTSSKNSSLNINSGKGELCSNQVLKERMDQIAESHGLGGVTMDCANIVNNGLNVYLKRLIKSCVELVGARSGHEPIRQPVYKQQPNGKIINGMLQGNHTHAQSSSMFSEGLQNSKRRLCISLPDFIVAMELNPQQLGDDWPSLLERICLSSYEE